MRYLNAGHPAFAVVGSVCLAGCSGLFDIPDNPHLVVASDAPMTVIGAEPVPSDDRLPSPMNGPSEGPAAEGTPVSPPLNSVDTSDTSGGNVANEHGDAGASALDAGTSTLDAGAPGAGIPPVPPFLGCNEPASLGPDGRCFMVVTTLLSWYDARLQCRARGPGWDLASIRDDAVNQFMGALGAGEAWIGASDADEEGLWIWVDAGSSFWNGDGETGSATQAAYENWYFDEPNGGIGSACARLVFIANQAPHPPPAWADLECLELRRSVCEGPPQ